MKISIQTGSLPEQFGIEQGYRMIAEAGFESIDWNVDHAIAYSTIKELRYRNNCIFEQSLDDVLRSYDQELNAIRKNGLEIGQAHSFFPNYVTGHPEVTDWAAKVHCRVIEFMAAVGCKYLVIHGIGLAPDDKANTAADIEALNYRLYEPMIDTLLQHDVTVCLENAFTARPGQYLEGHCADPHQTAAQIDRLNALAGREVFGLCVDSGHLNLLGKDFRTYGPAVGRRLKVLHLHDNAGNRDAHMAPLTGSIDWRAFLDTLAAMDYRGNLSLETFAQTDRAWAFDP